ncbi:MAG TPA: DUF192 domain-containing protein, partial [Polyangiaceae bacterium]|nr:DUF192 domain-containing protein [Polyangiaceae bacterium]
MLRPRAPLVALSLGFCGLLSLGSSCEKVTPEPAAQPTAVAAVGPASVALSSAAPPSGPRPACLRKTPAAPPPPPRYSLDPACPKDPAGGPPMVPVGHVAFPESKDAPRLEVELMITNEQHQRGLMYRRSLADDKGMLFAWQTPTIQSFWMHNTCIPLDMLFIDREGFVAGIVENAPTLDDGARSIDCPVLYVLEVAAGWSRKHGIVA